MGPTVSDCRSANKWEWQQPVRTASIPDKLCTYFTASSCATQVWQPDPAKPALKLLWSPFGILTCLFYLAATVYYFYVRFRFTMALGVTSW